MPVSNEVAALMQKELADNGQTNFIPLFPVSPSEIKHASIAGEIVKGNFDNWEFHVHSVTGELIANYAITSPVEEANPNAVLNIGKFVCIRDFTSRRGNVFVKNITFRIFAYAA